MITKLVNLGETLEDMITKATSAPADHFKLKDIGHLKQGYKGDLSLSKWEEVNKDISDSDRNNLRIINELSPVYTIISKNNKSHVVDNER